MLVNIYAGLLAMLLSCNNSTDKKSSAADRKEVANQFAVDSTVSENLYGPSDSTIHLVDSTIINGQLLQVTYLGNGTFFIRDQRDSVIYWSAALGEDLRFQDFDNDGYEDLLATSGGFSTGSEHLMLYDPSGRVFRSVEDFSEYTFIERIGNTKYLTSYKASGCADMNWYSYLFYVDHFKVKKIGVIQGVECEYQPDDHGLFIYQVNGDSGTLKTTLPISTVHRNKDGKMGYISQYWKKNYMKFTQ